MNRVLHGAAIVMAAGAMVLTAAPGHADGARLRSADRNAALDQPEYYGPKAAFDPQQARLMLAEGTTTIRGYLYHTVNDYGRKGTLFVPGGPARSAGRIKVYLYPATPHLVEWQQLYAKEQGPKIRPPIVQALRGRQRPRILQHDPRLMDFRLVTETDQYGRFAFEKMLPGRYYITAAADISGSYAGNEVIGNSTAYDGFGYAYSVEHTRPTTHNYNTSVFMEKFVEVRPGASLLELDFKLK